MQKQVEDILKASIDNKELCLNTYYKGCYVYCIDSNRNCYELKRETIINFEIASIGIVQKINKGYSILCMFVTNPKFRRMGYARNLLTCICEIYERINLKVRTSNESAINLYKSLGFKLGERIENFYSYTDTPEDAYDMTR